MTGTEVSLESWIKRYPAENTASGPTLVFPHAGGAALAYRPFALALAEAGSDAYVMQYPLDRKSVV